jgi:hypothetical protein
MPLILNPSEELAWLIGESLNSDVECWEAEPNGNAARLTVTRDGIDYEIEIREAHEHALSGIGRSA